jgi:hypothetical protein
MGTIVASVIILVEAAVAFAILGGVPAALGYGVHRAFKRH